MAKAITKKKLPPELETLAGHVGAFIQYWGFKRIHGQIWTHIFLSGRPLDAGELIRRLGVSKALISMSLSDLLDYEVIEVVGKGPRGTSTYRANPNITEVIMNVLRKREQILISQVENACRLAQGIRPEEKDELDLDSEQLIRLTEMTQNAQGVLAAFLSLSSPDVSIWENFKTCESKQIEED